MTEAKPLFSILMISYNHVQFIKAAIESVKNQTYKNWELIINDDCSTDGTFELATALSKKDKRIRVYRNKTNLTTPKNRAEAAKYVRGELVSHLDSDDMLYPHSIEYMVNALNSHPDVALMYSDRCIIDVKNNVLSYHKEPDYQTNLAYFGWKHFGVYRKSIYDTTKGYNTQITSACEDGDLFMQIAENHKFMRVPHVLYYHRATNSNQSSKNNHCSTCPDRPVCNYIKIWSKHAKYDPITFTPLKND
jgi:glycosyltransferase involved in cell wall biosynthesis